MQSGEPSETGGQESAPAGRETGGELTDAILSESPAASEPLFKGEAIVLWTTAGSTMAIFLIVIILIMRMNARTAIRGRRKNPSGDFFQPAGDGAEISFDDGGSGAAQAAAAGDLRPRRADAGEEEGAPSHPQSRRAGLWGLFGGRRKKPALLHHEGAVSDQRRDAAPPHHEPLEPLRAHPLAKERRTKSVAALRPDRDERAAGAPGHDRRLYAVGAAATEAETAEAPRHSEDEAARARRQVEEEFRRIEEERRASAARDFELERRREIAALDQQRRGVEERERAFAEQASALEKRAEDLRRDLAGEIDARFAALAGQIGDQVARAASPPAARDEHSAGTSTALHDLEERISGLAEKLGQRTAGASDEQVAAIANLVARRIAEQRDAADSAIAALASRIESLAAEMQKMEDVRREFAAMKSPPPANGAACSAPVIQLSDIIRDALPPDVYEMRAVLSNNRKADCLVRLPHPLGPIAIDGQFPVEAFHRLQAQDAKNDPRAENEFRRAALRHVADVAERLISPGETADSALLFVPSESLYSALHARFQDVIQDSYRAHVWIVSPTTLMAALHTMRAVLRDMAPPGAGHSCADARGVLAELGALGRRIGALEGSLAGARQEPASSAALDDHPGEAPDESRAEEAAPDEPAPAPKPADWKDTGEGDLWEDDQPADKSGAPFPLR